MGSRLFREQEMCGFDSRGADRSFVQWEGRGPTNRRRGFDSLSSDERRAIHSPIEGREPAFEAGDVGSIPARGAQWDADVTKKFGGRGVLACTPLCERGGAGSIPAGHPTIWVWVNGWPPGPEPGPRRFDSCRPDKKGQCSWESSRSPKPTNSVRIVADPQRGPNGFGYLEQDNRRGQHLVRVLEGAAEWPATGPENPGRGAEPERLPSATSRHRGFAAMYRSVRSLRLPPMAPCPSG